MLGLMVNDPNIEAEELSKITVPTLVISGTKDMIKESHTKEIAKALPNAKLAIIEGSHFIASENPKVFNRSSVRWIRSVPTGAAACMCWRGRYGPFCPSPAW